MSSSVRALSWCLVASGSGLLLAMGCGQIAGIGDFGDAETTATGGAATGGAATGGAATGGAATGGDNGGGGGQGGAATCSDEIDCTVEVMGPEGCVRTLDDSLCDDDNPCTTGSCVDELGCVQTPAADASGCGNGECDAPFECDSGTCSGVLECPGSSQCNSGTCTDCLGDPDCPSDIVPIWSACACSGECATSGMQERSVTTFTCDVSGDCQQGVDVQMQGCSCDTEDDPCSSDGNSCTRDRCKSGVCTSSTVADGTVCLSGQGQNYLCCGGTCRFTQNNDAHCGGCGVVCQGALSCADGYCRSCSTDDQCSQDVSAGFTCNKSMGADRCECDGSASCPLPWHVCDAVSKCRGID